MQKINQSSLYDRIVEAANSANQKTPQIFNKPVTTSLDAIFEKISQVAPEVPMDQTPPPPPPMPEAGMPEEGAPDLESVKKNLAQALVDLHNGDVEAAKMCLEQCLKPENESVPGSPPPPAV